MTIFRQLKAEEIQRHLAAFRNGVKQRIPDELVNIDFKVLKDAIFSLELPQEAPAPIDDWRLLDVDNKIDYNNLGEESKEIIKGGVIYIATVEKFINARVGNGDDDFPDRLTNFFKSVYAEYYCNGKRGDDLFDLILLDLQNQIPKRKVQKAIYAILAYLFEKCLVFEKPEAASA